MGIVSFFWKLVGNEDDFDEEDKINSKELGKHKKESSKQGVIIIPVEDGNSQVKKESSNPKKENKLTITERFSNESKNVIQDNPAKKGKGIKQVNFNRNINFVIDSEKIPEKGEDGPPIFLQFEDNSIVLGVADGMGGAGGTVYDYKHGKYSGAYLASRAVNSTAEKYFISLKEAGYEIDPTIMSKVAADLKENFNYSLNQILDNVSQKGAKLNLKSNLIKRLPTTFALSYIKPFQTNIEVYTYWAGDSRIYALSSESGLHQLTEDDLVNKVDAYENLLEDSPISNCINADRDYQINSKCIELSIPQVIFATTDGIFNYLPTPLHFELLLLQSLMTSSSFIDWRDSIKKISGKNQSDDISFALSVISNETFTDFKESLVDRYNRLRKEIEELEKFDQDIREQELKLEEANKKKKSIYNRVADFEEELTELTQKSTFLQKSAESVDYEILKAKNRIEEKKKELLDLEKRVDQLQIELANYRIELEESLKKSNQVKVKMHAYKEQNVIPGAESIESNLNEIRVNREKFNRVLWLRHKKQYELYLK